MTLRRYAPCVVVLSVVCAPTPARAQAPPPAEPAPEAPAGPAAEPLVDALAGLGRAAAAALSNLYFFAQMQAGAHTTVADGEHHGGFGVHAGATVVGVGGSAAVRYERALRADGLDVRRGLLLALAPELRPVALAMSPLHRYVDPYVSLGAEIGGNEVGFRASGYGVLGVDLGPFGSEPLHPALTVQYQFRAFQTPGDFPRHLLHVGAALRAEL